MADRFWVGGSGNWSDATNHWSDSSGGTPNASFLPTASDDVYFDAASNGAGTGSFTVTVNGTLGSRSICRNFSTGGTGGALDGAMTLSLSGAYLDCYGSLTLPASNFTWSAASTGYLTFKSTSAGNTITTNGVTLTNTLTTIDGVGGLWALGSALTNGGDFQHLNGTFDTANYALTVNRFIAITGTKTIKLGSSTVTITSPPAGNEWVMTSANTTFDCGTSTIYFNNRIYTFTGSGQTYYNVSVVTPSAVSTTFTGTNTYNNFTVRTYAVYGLGTIYFDSNQTINGTLTIQSGNTNPLYRVLIASSAVSATRVISAAAVSFGAGVDLRSITAAGSAIPWDLSALGGGDCKGNSNITFPSAKTVYWNLAGSQNWSSTGWATTNNGVPAAGNFPLAQDTATFTEAGAAGTVTMDYPWNIGVIQMADGVSNRTTAFTLALGNSTPNIYGNVTLFSNLSLTGTGGALGFFGQGTTQKLIDAGLTLATGIIIDNGSGVFQLQANLTVASTQTVTLTSGTLDLNEKILSAGIFSSNNSNARTIAFGTGNITLTGNNTSIWTLNTATNLTITGTPVVNATYSGATGTRTFSHGATAGKTEANAVNLNVTAGTDTVTTTANSGIRNLNFTGFAGTLTNTARTIYGNLTLGSGMTITDGTNITSFASASGTQTITSNGRTFDAPITIGSATQFPTVELADALNLGARNLTVTAGTFDTKGYNVTCASLQSLGTSAYTRAIKLNNSTVTLSSFITFNLPNNFTFDAGTSSIVLTGATPQLIGYYRANYTFYNVSFTNSAVTNIFMPNSGNTVTFNNLSFPNATTTSYGVVMGGNIKVNGTLTLPTGSSYINRVTFYSFDGSTIDASAISGTLTDVDFRGITVTGPTAPWTGTRLGNGGGNSGITGFEAPKTVYWSLAGGGNWSATAWATSSGGTPAVANYPILGDTVIFDNAGLNTSATVTVDRAFAINNLDFSARSNAMTFAVGTTQRLINGNFTASSGITFSGTGNTYSGPWSGTSTFTSAGRTISFNIIFSTGPTGNLVFADNLTFSAIGIFSGNVDLNGKTFFASGLITSQISALTIVNLNGATITSSVAGSMLNLSVGLGSFGYKIFTGTCTFNCSSASAKSIQNGAMADLSGFTFVNTGAGALTFANATVPGFNDGQYGTYGDIQTTVLPATINFTAGQTFQFNRFTISGTSGNLVTLASSTAGTRATLLSPNVVNSVSFCSIKDLNAINTMGYGEWQAYTTNGNVDAGNNTGWLFSPVTPSTAPRPTIRLRSLAQRGNMT